MDIKYLTQGTRFSFRYIGDLIQGEVFKNEHGLLLGFNCKELARQNRNTNNKYPHNYAIGTNIDSFLNIPYLTEFKILSSSTTANNIIVNSTYDFGGFSVNPIQDTKLSNLKSSILPDIKKRKLSPLSIDL